MSWKSESEARLARAIAQAEVEGMNIDSVRAQAAATLALVEVTERLAVAQETANLIAFVAHIDSIGDPVGNPSPEVLNAAKEAGRRAVKAMGL